ncbi:MAG: pro-sigmaK processing inhibitor BofA family protein [Euryarchaeota archaeon]|nr:pro-sigmaK processing inhibitor BofA family protein [Euryarchaeota archaeon]
MITSIILLIIAVVFLIVAYKVIRSLVGLVINAILGVILFFVTNAIGITSIQVSVFNLLVCAIGGIPGALILIVLNVLGIY